MIRNIVLVKLRAGTSDAQIGAIREALVGLPFPGRTVMTVQRDAGLREGNMDLAIISEFVDAQAYRDWDADVEHNRIRRELLAPIAERVERCQVEL